MNANNPWSIVLGTRPEIIKMAPVIRACQEREIPVRIVHSGQHYSANMDAVFFDQLKLPAPHVNLEVGSGTQGRQLGRLLERMEPALEGSGPVLVHGDTNTTVAGAMMGARIGCKVGHVEAGLRSYDMTMPEEHNRIIADHLSTHLLSPTEAAAATLRGEGITHGVSVTGNTIVDAVQQNRDLAVNAPLPPGEYVLMTLHRAENVSNPRRLQGALDGARAIGAEHDLAVVFPAHPNTINKMKEARIGTDGLQLVEPLPFLEFLQLEANAKLILTDSGGLQEEACILGVPCVTMRENTERPETIEVGANRLAGTDAERIVAAATEALASPRAWKNPFGDGRAADRIVDAMEFA